MSGHVLIPDGINLVPNPSFRTGMTGWATGESSNTSTRERDTSFGWDGPHSHRITITSSVVEGYSFLSLPSSHRWPVIAGESYDLAMRWYTESPDVRVRFLRTWVDAAGAAVGTSVFVGTVLAYGARTGRWYTQGFEDQIAPAGATSVTVSTRLYTRIAGLSGVSAWFDGYHLAPSDVGVQAYVDGDQGPDYFWTGTANLSTSRRSPVYEQTVTGYGGVVEVDARVFLSSVKGEVGEDITDYVLDATVDFDIDRDGPKSTAKVTVTDPTIIPDYSWVAIFQSVEYENGRIESDQVGLFRLEQPKEDFDSQSVEVKMSGFDATVRLSDRTLEDTINLAPGQRYTAYIEAYLNVAGVRHSIPFSSKVIPAIGLTFKIGMSLLKVVNELCAAVGYYSVFANEQGVVTTMPIIENLHGVQPAFRYSIGQDTDMVGDFSFDPNSADVFNRVIVYRDDPAKGAPLRAVRSYTNPRSRVSTVNLGVKTREYAVQEATDQATLNALAAKYIQDRTMYVTGKIETLPSPYHRPHEVVDIDLSGMKNVPGADRHTGRYYVKGYSSDILSRDGTMQIVVRRVESMDAI